LMVTMSAALAQAQEVTSPQDPSRQMIRLAAGHNWDEAEALARAILKSHPDNVSALVVLARARRAAGDAEHARVIALRANANAKTNEEHYVAAVEVAAATYDLGKPMIAQLWLRRAVQMAPTDPIRARTLRDLQSVSAASPWNLDVQFSIAPSSNVNNGSLADTIDIGGLPFTLNPDARALAGYEMSLGLRARHQFRGLENLPAQLSFSAFTQRVALSGSAQEEVPDAQGSDYAFDALEVALGQSLNAPQATVRYRVDGAIGKTWYGGAELSEYVRLASTAQWGDVRQAVNTATLQAERQIRQDDSRRSATILNVGLRRDWRLASGDQLGLSLRARHTQSDSVEIDHDALIGGISYDFGEVFDGAVTLGSAFEIEQRKYGSSLYSFDTRHDRLRRIAVTVGFPRHEFYGFSPQIRIEAEKVNSSVDFYDRSDVTVRFGIRSVF
jgi:hypothetical protein